MIITLHFNVDNINKTFTFNLRILFRLRSLVAVTRNDTKYYGSIPRFSLFTYSKYNKSFWVFSVEIIFRYCEIYNKVLHCFFVSFDLKYLTIFLRSWINSVIKIATKKDHLTSVDQVLHFSLNEFNQTALNKQSHQLLDINLEHFMCCDWHQWL